MFSFSDTARCSLTVTALYLGFLSPHSPAGEETSEPTHVWSSCILSVGPRVANLYASSHCPSRFSWKYFRIGQLISFICNTTPSFLIHPPRFNLQMCTVLAKLHIKPIRPLHSLPPAALLQAQIRPYLIQRSTTLTQQLQSTRSQNDQVFELITAQRQEIGRLIGLVEALLLDVEHAAAGLDVDLDRDGGGAGNEGYRQAGQNQLVKDLEDMDQELRLSSSITTPPPPPPPPFS